MNQFSYSITAGNPVVDDTTNPVTKLFTIDSATGVIKLTSGQSLISRPHPLTL